jgi:hypothetical protein
VTRGRLTQRISELERRAGSSGRSRPILILNVVHSMTTGKEIDGVCSIDGKVVERLPGEPYEKYKARSVELTASMTGARIVYAWY